MIITIPLFLLILGALTFWLLIESELHWVFKIGCISLFCFFTIQFYFSINSFLGWAANNMPEKVAIHWIVIKEPNPMFNEKGRIYLLLDGEKSQYENHALKMFQYYTNKREPRLYSIPYSRNLHEQLQKDVIPSLQKGQIVQGKIGKRGKGGKGSEGSKDGKEGKGESESLTQEGDGEYEFHKLIPGEIHQK